MSPYSPILSFCSPVAATAVVVFLIFPRNTGGGILGPFQMHAGQTLTGFSESVNLDEVAKITQNTDKVAEVKG